MGNRDKGFSLDRIDVHGNYCKENCRWATTVQQANNKQKNRIVEFGGERLTLAQWAARLGVGWFTLRARLDNYGWDVERTLTEAVRTDQLYEFEGVTLTMAGWSERTGIHIDTLRSRLNRMNWSLKDTLTLPPGPKGSHRKVN
jgi:hypothetical protein